MLIPMISIPVGTRMKMKSKPLYCRIFDDLRDRIVFGVYPPGTSLPEKELCQEFKVSRTPLREAFSKLQDMKLVTVIPRFGTTVTAVDIHEIRCAFEVKIKLEGLAGELAAERIEPEKLDELDGVISEAARLLAEAQTSQRSVARESAALAAAARQRAGAGQGQPRPGNVGHPTPSRVRRKRRLFDRQQVELCCGTWPTRTSSETTLRRSVRRAVRSRAAVRTTDARP